MELFRLFGRIAVDNDEANQNIDETTDRAEEGSQSMTGSFKKIGAAVAAYFSFQAIKDFGTQIVNASAEVSAEASAFSQIMGNYADEASGKVNKIADTTGMVSTRLTPYMTSMTAKFKGLGYDIDDATNLASDGLNLAADAAAFWDKSLDDSMSALNSFINGSYEGGEAIGLFANDTQMASYAVKNGIVSETKEWANLDEAKKQATRLEYAQAMMKASGATGQAAKESGQYANVQANLSEKWRQFKAQIGEPLLQNVVIPAMDKLSTVVDTASEKFESLKTWVSENKTVLTAIGTVIGSVTAGIVAFKIATAAAALQAKLHTAATIAEKLAVLGVNTAMLASPITWIVAAVVALIAIIVLLVKNWDKVKEVAINVWNKIKEIWEKVATWFKTNVIDPIVNFFTELWSKISAIWDAITGAVSKAWETIKNAIKVAFMFIVELIKAYFNLITLPFRFIWENCKDTIMKVWNAIKTAITTALTNIKNTVTRIFNAVKTVITTVFNTVKTFITTVWNGIKTKITTVVNAIRTFVFDRFNAIKEKITTPLNEAKERLSNIFNSIKMKIIGVINDVKNKVATVFLNVKSSIETPLNNAKNRVSNIFNSIKTTISNTINGAKNTVQKGINAIKGFFDKLKLKFPNIKLPHFSLSGKFSLSPPSVPKLSIKWYKDAMDNAMLLNSPTIFGAAGSSLLGGGEAGQEVVSGASTLMNMIKDAVRQENSVTAYYLEKLISMLATYFPEILDKLQKEIVLDDETLVGRIVPKVDRGLGNINTLRKRGT